jgi:hypothetical protein
MSEIMKRALFVGGIAVSFGGGVLACGELVGLGTPPSFVPVDASTVDGADDGSANDRAAEADVDADAAPIADASDDVADASGGACVFDLGPGSLQPNESWNVVAQTLPAAVTKDANTLLIQQAPNNSAVCGSGLSLVIADDPEGSGSYTRTTVTPPAQMDTSSEENVTITNDGKTLIALNQGDTAFLTSTRPQVGGVTVVFAAAETGPFGLIQAAANQTLWAPVISADGLEFFYVVRNDPDAGANGIYESVRDGGGSFPSGIRMPDLIQDAGLYVTGITADRKSLFVEVSTDAGNVVFTRDATSEPFVNPNAPGDPPVGALRARPFGTCNQIVATCSGATNCQGDQICQGGQR